MEENLCSTRPVKYLNVSFTSFPIEWGIGKEKGSRKYEPANLVVLSSGAADAIMSSKDCLSLTVSYAEIFAGDRMMQRTE